MDGRMEKRKDRGKDKVKNERKLLPSCTRDLASKLVQNALRFFFNALSNSVNNFKEAPYVDVVIMPFPSLRLLPM